MHLSAFPMGDGRWVVVGTYCAPVHPPWDKHGLVEQQAVFESWEMLERVFPNLAKRTLANRTGGVKSSP